MLLCLLAAVSMKCSDIDMATDGICESSLENLSPDSVYAMIYCYGVGKNTDISIFQLLNADTSLLLKADDVELYKDGVAIPFSMQNSIGKRVDSLLTSGHDVIKFHAKVGQMYKRAPRFSIKDIKRNPIIKLVQHRRESGDSIVVSFDLNQDSVMIRDIRFFDLLHYMHYMVVYDFWEKTRLISDSTIKESINRSNENYKRKRTEIMDNYSREKTR
jgi:hypothetical protein